MRFFRNTLAAGISEPLGNVDALARRRRAARCAWAPPHGSAVFAATLVGLACAGAAPSQEPERYRTYAQGPLVAEDFRGEADTAHDAYTATDLRFNYRYVYREAGNGVRAELSEFHVFAIFDPLKSWNRKPRDAPLLAHEQGHFDLTHAAALRVDLHVHRQMTAGEGVFATGSSRAEAVRLLEAAVREIIAKEMSLLRDAHKEYDSLTSGGRHRANQAEQMRILSETLRRLEAERSKIEVERSLIRSGDN